jgi:hypothetical protein
VKYYNIPRYWNRIEKHLYETAVQTMLVTEMNKYTQGMWKKPFLFGMKPFDFDCYDWYLSHRGRIPRFWDYTCSGACHWLANFNLLLAFYVSDRPWRIIKGEKHSTVWDGKDTLFEMNWLAYGIPADETYKVARKRPSFIVPVGSIAVTDEPDPKS